MRIILGSTYHYSAYPAGNERYAHELALGLTAAGHTLTYITASPPPAAKPPYRLICLPITRFLRQPLPTFGWLRFALSAQADCYHACGSGLPLILVAGIFRLRRIPTILTFPAPTNPTSPLHRLAAALEIRLLPRVFSAFLATSPPNKRFLSQLWPRKSVFCVPLSISSAFLQPVNLPPPLKRQPGSRYLLFIGRLDHHHYYKGLPVLLSALTDLPAAVKLWVVGTGDDLALYRIQVKQAGLQSRVSFLGHVPDDRLPAIIRAADLLVLPSTSNSEGFGLVLIEAMAVGTPTLTTTVVGIYPWFKPKRLTEFVPPNNASALAGGIRRCLDHPDPGRIRRAQLFARSLTLAAMTHRTVAAYRKLV